MPSKITFNCGEFRPGKKIIRKAPKKTPIIIVKNKPVKTIDSPFGKKIPPFDIKTPGGGRGSPGGKFFRCVVTGKIGLEGCTIKNPFGLPVILVTPGIKRKCILCTDADKKNPKFSCVPEAICKKNCKDTPPVCKLKEVITGGGVIIDDVQPVVNQNEIIVSRISPFRPIKGGESISVEPAIPSTLELEENSILKNRITKQSVLPDSIEKLQDDIDQNSGPQKSFLEIDIHKEWVKSLSPGAEVSAGSLFSLEYNLAENAINPLMDFLPNVKFLNIFKETVTEEVKYFLDINDTSSAWSETFLNNLTLEKIAYSLRLDLLTALSQIIKPGGKKVRLDSFLTSIADLLISGQLKDFNTSYYINLSKKQRNEPRVEFLIGAEDFKKTQAALGLIASDSIFADPEAADDEGERPYLRRARIFNTDFHANIPIQLLTEVSVPTFLSEDGFQVTLIEGGAPVSGGAIVDLGEGGGYYFSAVLVDDSLVPVLVAGNLSSTVIPIAATRTNALDILDVDSSLTFKVSSTYENSEFGDSYDLTSVYTPSYFILDLSTVGTEVHPDSIITQTSGIYRLETEASLIATHAKSNGYNVVAANIDYNDPFLVYAQDSQQMVFSTKDVTFQKFFPQSGNQQNAIIARSIPFAVVLNPGQGSAHNPFAGSSKLVSMDPVEREVDFIPDIAVLDDGNFQIALESKLLIDEIGSFQLGLVEPLDVDNVLFQFETSASTFQNTYFDDETTGSVPPTDRTRSSAGIIANSVIDNNLKLRYEIPENHITWYDVWRRLKPQEVFDFSRFDGKEMFEDWLSHGGRGITISDVLNRFPIVKTGLGDVKNDAIVDNIIIEDRHRAIN